MTAPIPSGPLAPTAPTYPPVAQPSTPSQVIIVGNKRFEVKLYDMDTNGRIIQGSFRSPTAPINTIQLAQIEQLAAKALAHISSNQNIYNHITLIDHRGIHYAQAGGTPQTVAHAPASSSTTSHGLNDWEQFSRLVLVATNNYGRASLPFTPPNPNSSHASPGAASPLLPSPPPVQQIGMRSFELAAVHSPKGQTPQGQTPQNYQDLLQIPKPRARQRALLALQNGFYVPNFLNGTPPTTLTQDLNTANMEVATLHPSTLDANTRRSIDQLYTNTHQLKAGAQIDTTLHNQLKGVLSKDFKNKQYVMSCFYHMAAARKVKTDQNIPRTDAAQFLQYWDNLPTRITPQYIQDFKTFVEALAFFADEDTQFPTWPRILDLQQSTSWATTLTNAASSIKNRFSGNTTTAPAATTPAANNSWFGGMLNLLNWFRSSSSNNQQQQYNAPQSHATAMSSAAGSGGGQQQNSNSRTGSMPASAAGRSGKDPEVVPGERRHTNADGEGAASSGGQQQGGNGNPSLAPTITFGGSSGGAAPAVASSTRIHHTVRQKNAFQSGGASGLGTQEITSDSGSDLDIN